MAYDGCLNPQGPWAKHLWRLEEEGLLETKPIPAGRFLWGLTDEGLAELTRSEVASTQVDRTVIRSGETSPE